MRLHAPLLLLALAACKQAPDALLPQTASLANSPEIGRAAPQGWRLAAYVNGLALSVPPEAKVARPQGIDSNLLVIEGRGFTLDLDDYGAFSGAANATLDGRRAHAERDSSPGCKRMSVSVENGRSSNMHMCDADGQDCHAAPGAARIGGHCIPGDSCETMEAIIASVRFEPSGATEPLPIDPNYRGHPPVCNMPDEGNAQPL